MKTRNTNLSILAVVVILATLGTFGCGTLTPPPQLGSEGKVAFYSQRLAIVTSQLQDLAVQARDSGLITVQEARVVGDYTVKMASAGKDLSAALSAGESQSDAKHAAIAALQEALKDLPKHLSKNAASLIQPYVDQLVSLLGILSKF